MKPIGIVVLFTLIVEGYCGGGCQWGASYWCKSEDNARECQRTQYCQENVWKSVSSTKPGSKVGGVECTICQAVVEIMDKALLANETESEAKMAVEKVCDAIGVLKEECVSLVNQYFDDVWKALVNQVDPDSVCSVIGLCSSTPRHLSARPEKKKKASSKVDGIECYLCKEIAKEIIQLVNANATKQEAKTEIKKVCPYLGGFAPQCRELIDDFFDDIWNMVISAVMDPNILCQKVQLCPAKKLSKIQAMPQDTICDLCNMAVDFLKTFVDSNSSEDEVKSALESFCKLLPNSSAGQCTKLVDEYFPIIWDLIKEEVDSGEICKQIGLCNETKVHLPLLKKSLKAPTDLCDTCKLVTSFLRPYFDSNATEAQVKEALESLCGLLPGTQCTAIVDMYFDDIWDMVKKEVDGDLICEQLGLCSATRLLSKDVPQLKKAPPPGFCSICKLVVNFLKPYIDSNSTEDEVKSDLEGACKLLYSTIQSDCTEFVDTYFDLAWDMLKNKVDTGVVCDQLGFCNGTNGTKYVKSPIQSTGKASELCDMCKLAVTFLKTFVDSKATEDEAKAALEGLCNQTSILKDECDTLVDQYFPMIWKLISSYVDDDQICQEIKLCSASLSVEKVAMEKKNEKTGGIFCVICELVMKELESILVTNATEKEIIDALDKVCDFLPSTIKKDCTAFVDLYGKEIIEEILSGAGPKLVCSAIQLCLAKEEQYASFHGTTECDLCEYLLRFAKELMSSNEDSVKEVLDKVCILVPSEIQSECKVFMDTFSPELVQLLLKEIDPQAICTEIKLCAKKSSVLMEPWLKLARKY